MLQKYNQLKVNTNNLPQTQQSEATISLIEAAKLLTDAHRLLTEANDLLTTAQLDKVRDSLTEAIKDFTKIKIQFTIINDILAEAEKQQKAAKIAEAEIVRLQALETARLQALETARQAEETRLKLEQQKEEAARTAQATTNASRATDWQIRTGSTTVNAKAPLPPASLGNPMRKGLQTAPINISKIHQNKVLSEVENELALLGITDDDYDQIIKVVVSVPPNKLSVSHRKSIDEQFRIALKTKKTLRALNPDEYANFVKAISNAQKNKNKQQQIVNEYIRRVMLQPVLSRPPSYANAVRAQSPVRPAAAAPAAAAPAAAASVPAVPGMKPGAVKQSPHPLTVVAPVHPYVPKSNRLTQTNRGNHTLAKKTIQNATNAMQQYGITKANKSKYEKQITNAQRTITLLEQKYPQLRSKGGKCHTIRHTIKRRYNRTHKK